LHPLSRRFQQFTSTGGVDEDIALVDVRLLSKPPGMTEADIVDGENAWRLNLLNKLDERGVIHELIGTTGKTDTLVRAVGGTVKKGESLATLPTYFNPLTAFCDAESVAGGTVGLAAKGFQALDRAIRDPPCVEDADGAEVRVSVLERDGSVKQVPARQKCAHVRKEVVYAVLCVLGSCGRVPAVVMRSVPAKQHGLWVGILDEWLFSWAVDNDL
jgi:hypothetical protein